jgi:hypothetical protein
VNRVACHARALHFDIREALLDHLIGAGEQRGQEGEATRLCRL